MGLVWLHQINYGVGVSPDAILYLSVAENLSMNRGFADLYGWLYSYPPLFPSLLTLVVSLTAENGFHAARYVNIGIFGLTIITVLVWIYPKVSSKFWLVWAGAICALSPGLIHISSYARTDSMYVIFAVLSLYKLDRWLTRVKQSNLILSAVYASLSCLTRFSGLAVILTAFLIISLRKGIVFRAKIKYITVYSAIAILPPMIWLLRNYFTIGKLTQYSEDSGSFSSILYHVKWEFVRMVLGDLGDHYLWLLSNRLGITIGSMRDYFLIFSAATLGASVVYLYRKGMGGGLSVPLVFVLVYALFYSAAFQFDVTGFLPRYLPPIYVPLLVIVVIVLDRSLKRSSQSIKWPLILRRNMSKAVGLVALGFMMLLVPPTITSIKAWQENGISYASKYWDESETNRYVDSITIDGIVYSNFARVLFTHVDISDKAKVSFHQLRSSLSANDYTWDDRDYLWEDRSRGHELDRHVIWYNAKYRPYDFLAVASLSGLKIAMILEDGIVLADEGFEPVSVLDAVLRSARLVIRSEFDIYLDESRIIYLAEPCREINTEAPFFLHVVPASLDEPADQRKAPDINFDNHDFDFNQEGFRFGERCAAIRNLPDYNIKMIETGQYAPEGGTLWREEIYNPMSQS